MVSTVLLHADDFNIYISAHTSLLFQIYIFNLRMKFSSLNICKSIDNFLYFPTSQTQHREVASLYNQVSTTDAVELLFMIPLPDHTSSKLQGCSPHLLKYLSKCPTSFNPNGYQLSQSYYNQSFNYGNNLLTGLYDFNLVPLQSML